MSRTKQTCVAIRILGPTCVPRFPQPSGFLRDVPARSHLYGLAPCEVGTVWVESLSSYLHRLAARYCVDPRVFITETLFPHLASWCESRPSFATHLGSFYRREALAMNGTGELAQSLLEVLCQLTSRSDVRDTTLYLWANSLPTRGLLRWSPVWCPACYTAWRERGHLLYQPLVWMLQVVTVCVRHRCALIDRCPHCQQRQSVIAAKIPLGYCTQCAHWLGKESHPNRTEQITDEQYSQQDWIMRCIEELYLGSRAFGALPWTNLPQGLMQCREALGDGRSLARFTHLPYSVFWPWSHGKSTPSFKRLLEFGYALDVTPLELLVSTREARRRANHGKGVRAASAFPPESPPRSY